MTVKKTVAKQDASNKLPADVKEVLRRQAARQGQTAAAPTGRSVKPTHTGFKFPDGRIADSPMTVVVLDTVSVNAWYNTPYVAGQVKPAACAAHGFKPNDDLEPMEGCSEQQSESCYGCYQNEYGSANEGKGAGKACQNRKVMAILPPDAEPDDPILIINASPTSVTSIDGFVSALSAQEIPTVARTVEVHIVINENSNAVSIELKNPDYNPNIENMYQRLEEAHAMLDGFKPNIGRDSKPAAKGAGTQKALTKKKVAKKKVVRKKAPARR